MSSEELEEYGLSKGDGQADEYLTDSQTIAECRQRIAALKTEIQKADDTQ
jgi:hypothetical protein